MAFNFREQQAYFKGAYVPFSEARLSIASAPVLYGLAVYTVFNFNWNNQTQKGYFFRLEDHYQRLINSAKIMGFAPLKTILSYDDFCEIARQLVLKNDLKKDCLIRATVFIDEEMSGTKTHGLKIGFSAFIYPAADILPRTGAKLGVSSWRRTPDNAIPSRAKANGSYVNSTLIKSEALLNGFDDGLSLDEHGHVAESTVANFFMIRDGILVTPHGGTDILEGITRNTVVRLAQHLGIDCQERTIDRTELYLADEALLCGSSAHITPVLSIDHRPIGNAKPAPMTLKLSKLYHRVCREPEPEFSDWLTELF